MHRSLIAQTAVFITAVALCASLSGCKGPSRANIQLRKENQELQAKVDQLERSRTGDAAQIRSLESKATTVPVLPQDQLAKLFTVHGIQLGRLTGPADNGLKVYAVPLDDDGQPLKAAGSFVVEAFDLAKSDNQLVGRWEFSIDDARKDWFGQAMLYTYALPCPWSGEPPQHPDITVKTTFNDALTGRSFTAQKLVKLK